MLNIEFNHCIVHLRRLGKTNRTAMESLQVRTKVQVVPLNVLRPIFTAPMLRRRQTLAVRLPVIGIEGGAVALSELLL